jgi:hypothetical protein
VYLSYIIFACKSAAKIVLLFCCTKFIPEISCLSTIFIACNAIKCPREASISSHAGEFRPYAARGALPVGRSTAYNLKAGYQRMAAGFNAIA